MHLTAQWITGFTDGEGCFHVSLNQNNTMKLGYQVLPEFVVTQHKRDVNVLHALKDFFQCGVVRVNHGHRFCYRVRGQQHLLQRVIPFFEKHQLKTKKRIDFEKFRDVVLLMENKTHLDPLGLENIKFIVNSMNRRGDLGSNVA